MRNFEERITPSLLSPVDTPMLVSEHIGQLRSLSLQVQLEITKRITSMGLLCAVAGVSSSRPSQPFSAAREAILKLLMNFGSIATDHRRRNV